VIFEFLIREPRASSMKADGMTLVDASLETLPMRSGSRCAVPKGTTTVNVLPSPATLSALTVPR
jgi:hypothetical protein